MDVEQQFNLIAAEYDANRRKFIPCFDDFYQSTTELLAGNLPAPRRVLDLGAGTGLLAYFWYQHFPAAEYLLVDIADEMLKVARQRFAGLANVSYQILDYAEALPVQHFDVIISALSIHHLTDEEKERLFSRIYAKLPSGGLFVNYDQFCAEQPQINAWFNAYWENQLRASGLTAMDIELWQERRKLDKECSVEAEVAMLQAPAADFREVKCLYSCHKFSVIAAIK